MRFGRALTVLALALAASGVPLGCSGGVVGGECRQGLSVCEGRCLDFSVDPENCGACGNACPASQSCASGVCFAVVDAGTGGGGSGQGGGSGDGGASSGGAGGLGSGGRAGTGGAIVDGGGGGVIGAGGSPLDAGDASPGSGGADGGVAAGGTSGSDGGVSTGGASGAGGTGAGGTGGAGTGGKGGTGGADGGAPCPPPYDTPAHCGACDVQCAAPTGVCSPGNDGYDCVSLCTLPLVQCGQQCVNTDTDENNCGRCNRRCASQICQGGRCVGATAGHEIVLCMDYRTKPATGSPQQRLLGNSVFIPSANPVRVLGYTQYTSATNATAVKATLDAEATARNRTYTLTTVVTPLGVSNQLNVLDFDVLVVYDQPTAPAGALATTGATWSGTITSFVRAGGTVVVLAGDGGRAEMPELLTSAGILDTTGQTTATGTLLYNRALGDAVGLNVLSQFRGVRETCTFAVGAPDPTATYVVTDASAPSGNVGNPVVVHRVIAP